jgi:Ner family transcriptional regulator
MLPESGACFFSLQTTDFSVTITHTYIVKFINHRGIDTHMNTLPPFANARERTIWVQAQLRLSGKSFASIGRANGWGRGSVSAAMKIPSYPQEVALAEALGVSPRDLFPERYDLTGQRLHLVRQNTGCDDDGNVKHHEAA